MVRHSPASTGACIRPSLRSDVDLLCPLPTLALATGQALTVADPDHASVVRKSNKLQKEAAAAPETSGSGRCRCGATNYSVNLPTVASTITSSYVM